MNQIKFTAYKRPDKESIFIRDKFYSVWIGDHTRIQFKSKIKMKSYLVESSRFMTFKLYQYISLYSSIQKLFWDNWLYFSINHNNTNKKYLAGLKIKRNFEEISKSIDRMILEAKSPTGIYYVLKRFEFLKEHLIENGNLMLEQIPRANVAVHYRIKTHLSEIQLWENQIKKFGKMETDKIQDSELSEEIPVLKIVV